MPRVQVESKWNSGYRLVIGAATSITALVCVLVVMIIATLWLLSPFDSFSELSIYAFLVAIFWSALIIKVISYKESKGE